LLAGRLDAGQKMTRAAPLGKGLARAVSGQKFVVRTPPWEGGTFFLMVVAWILSAEWVLSSPSSRRIGLARKGNIPSLLLVFAATWML
jgi:hypothetical protein